MFDLFEPDKIEPRELRPHQKEARSKLYHLMKSVSGMAIRAVIAAPCGFGKSILAAEIIKDARSKGKRVALLVPAISLVDQTVAEFRAQGLTGIAVMQCSHPLTDRTKPIQICSIDTLIRREDRDFDVVIWDECHIRRDAVYEWMAEADGVHFIGLSATPWSAGMGDHWRDLIHTRTSREMIDAGYLCEYAVYAPSHPDMTGVKTRAGDYREEDLERVMGDSKLIADVVENWCRLGNNEPTLCFAVNRAHARALQEAFRRCGITFGYCDANTDLVERRHLFDMMARGEIKGICNVGTLTTGVDADVRTLILARPTKSKILFVQMMGRALRNAPGKKLATIIDHTDTTLRLGFPCSITQDGFTDGQKGKASTREAPERLPKECKECHYLKPVGIGECPKCGHKPENIRDIEAGSGSLSEISRGEKKRAYSKEEKQAWYSQLLHYAIDRGKSESWVKAHYRGKFDVWPSGLHRGIEPPSQEVLNYIRSRQIAWAKRKQAEARNAA